MSYNPKHKEVAEDFARTFVKEFFAPRHFQTFKKDDNGKTFVSWYYSQNADRIEDKQHGSAEINDMSHLYRSGLYRDIFTEEHVTIIRDTVKYHLYRGKNEKTGEELFASELSKRPPLNAVGNSSGLPGGYFWLFDDDPEFKSRILKSHFRNKKAPMVWKDYLFALTERIR